LSYDTAAHDGLMAQTARQCRCVGRYFMLYVSSMVD